MVALSPLSVSSSSQDSSNVQIENNPFYPLKDEDEFWAVARTQSFDKVREAVSRNPRLALLRDGDSHTLLHWAALLNLVAEVPILLEAGADANARSRNGQTPFMWAAVKGHCLLLREFNERARINLNVADSLGATPLILSVQHGHKHAFLLLLRLGANIESADVNGCTAAHWAAFKGDIEFLELLRYFRADLTVPDKSGKTPLHRAAGNGEHAAALWVARNSEVNIDAVDQEGKTAAGLAEGFPPLVAALANVAKSRAQQQGVRGGRESSSSSSAAVRSSGRERRGGVGVERERLTQRGGEDENSFLGRLAEILDLESGHGGEEEMGGVGEEGSANQMSNREREKRIPRSWLGRAMLRIRLLGSLLSEGTEREREDERKTDARSGHGKGSVLPPLTYLSFFALSIVHFHAEVSGRIDPSDSPFISSIAAVFPLVYLSALGLYAALFRSNPGIIPPRPRGASAFEDVQEVLMSPHGPSSMEEIDVSRICTTCLVRRGLRTKHCRMCDVCVDVMDHHCVWIRGCVGQGNHRLFFVFCVAQEVTQILWAVLMWFHLSALLSDAEGEGETFFWRAMCFLFQAPLSTFIFLWDACTSVCLLGLIFAQMRGIFKNLTFNEEANAHRYGHFWYFTETRDAEGRVQLVRSFRNPFASTEKENCLRFWSANRSSAASPAPSLPGDRPARAVSPTLGPEAAAVSLGRNQRGERTGKGVEMDIETAALAAVASGRPLSKSGASLSSLPSPGNAPQENPAAGVSLPSLLKGRETDIPRGGCCAGSCGGRSDGHGRPSAEVGSSRRLPTVSTYGKDRRSGESPDGRRVQESGFSSKGAAENETGGTAATWQASLSSATTNLEDWGGDSSNSSVSARPSALGGGLGLNGLKGREREKEKGGSSPKASLEPHPGNALAASWGRRFS
uniref:Palmitoyltransferase DHHC domain-containing protein n=1 Tax=Chromera velia CCMP2878 TaxID=1169474 RepID=A0A0G4I2Y4_9ALVE|eukprot:Cvel_10495.t1-p1 / transcript=Cvel_10495.t1 / gene=Cvel_10495 / organism=Chromera_velia_CCMP2878 / gene_product=Putative ankyrin repeat protein MM_0045, putative / transcript_product=Putative ankyrin repeat protein MM_0045, putative / location=Cvel_scaffold634:46123-53007(-) / protein_length=910 / sequence_SO=supercontig / SO=protein_coding / is_pseudo=false